MLNGKIIFLSFFLVLWDPYPSPIALINFLVTTLFVFRHPVPTSSHVIDLSLSLPDHRLSFRSQNISYISLFLQDRRARVETIRSTETIAAVILVNKVNKIQAFHIQTSTFIHMFMSDILHLLTIITFECDMFLLHSLWVLVRPFSFTFITSISANFHEFYEFTY